LPVQDDLSSSANVNKFKKYFCYRKGLNFKALFFAQMGIGWVIIEFY
jgi:hypothetical protein